MNDEETGTAFESLYYPGRFYRRGRERRYARLSLKPRERLAVIEDEDGRVVTFPTSREGYQQAATYGCRERLTVLTRFREGQARFPWLGAASEDHRARILATEGMGIIGVSIQRGRQYMTFISESSWHIELLRVQDTGELLRLLRRASLFMAVGDFDTPAALGTNLLFKFWRELDLPLVKRAPGALEENLRLYRNGGRIEQAGQGRSFPTLHEHDIRRAFPTVVAAGLPWGNATYMRHEPQRHDIFQALYGIWTWHIHQDQDIALSPVPRRAWYHPGSKTAWNLTPGFYRYAGWSQEIQALRDLGVAVEFRSGWAWRSVSSDLAPWVEHMFQLRERAERAGDTDVATLVKIATNAAIGRWGGSGGKLQLVDIDRSVAGDAIVSFPSWSFLDTPGESPLLALHAEEGRSICLPNHWSSYVQMRVRMEVYRIALRERSRGNPVMGVMIDGLLAERPMDTSGSEFAWKSLVHRDALLPYPQAIRSTVDGVYTEKMPGMTTRERLNAMNAADATVDNDAQGHPQQDTGHASGTGVA